MDYIETVEKYKEDYEADVMEDDEEDHSRAKTPEEDEEELEQPMQQMKPVFIGGKKRYNYSEDNDFMPAHQVRSGDSGIR